MSSADVARAERFERLGLVADAATAARTREEFAEWLDAHFDLDPIRSSDLILATNEALANAAEFAYRHHAAPGTMDVRAEYDTGSAKLTVTIADHGAWRRSGPHPPARSRGRGIPLMEALTDFTSIESTSEGTRVVLQWHDVAVRSRPA